jgi:hypothetical protein
MSENDDVYRKSNFYDQLTEHVFVSEILQETYFRYNKIVEVLHSEIDCSGYDVVLECNGYIRHVQLKTSAIGASTSRQKVNIALSEKPSGCIVWIERKIQQEKKRVELLYKYFGGSPGHRLPAIDNFKVAKHTKANAQGIKDERPAIRVIPKSCFKEVEDITELISLLFGLYPPINVRRDNCI